MGEACSGMLQCMTACHRVQEQEIRLYEHVTVVSQLADSDNTIDSAYAKQQCTLPIEPLAYHFKHCYSRIGSRRTISDKSNAMTRTRVCLTAYHGNRTNPCALRYTNHGPIIDDLRPNLWYFGHIKFFAIASERNSIFRSGALYIDLHSSAQHVDQESRGVNALRRRSRVRLLMVSETDATQLILLQRAYSVL